MQSEPGSNPGDSVRLGPSVPADVKGVLEEVKRTGQISLEVAEQAMQKLKEAYYCYHRIKLTDTLFLPGRMTREQEVVLAAMAKHLKRGNHVMDVGCRDGLFSLEAARLGAARIVSVDNDRSDLFTDIVMPWFGLNDIEYVIENCLFLGPEYGEKLDLIVFSGVLYHLRYPMYGIQRMAEMLRPNGILILETAYLDAFNEFPILLCPIGDESPYEATSVTFFNRKGLRDTLKSLGFSIIQIADEFTYQREKMTDYDLLPFPGGTSTQTIGRLIWVCQKSNPKIENWMTAFPSVEVTRRYWNARHHSYHR
jgi:2-polyprenyl-3-methyl-5-hydroxy-6-metoxy-1,4-benzoquinol methylase